MGFIKYLSIWGKKNLQEYHVMRRPPRPRSVFVLYGFPRTLFQCGFSTSNVFFSPRDRPVETRDVLATLAKRIAIMQGNLTATYLSISRARFTMLSVFGVTVGRQGADFLKTNVFTRINPFTITQLLQRVHRRNYRERCHRRRSHA